VPVEGVADAPLKGAQGLLGALSLGELLVVVGTALAVQVPDLGDRAMWTAWLSRRFPRRDSRCTFRFPEETSIGAVPL
jgi:hypothetical protein